MPKKKTKVSKKDKQAARKKADELVGVGNGHLENALAARKQRNIVASKIIYMVNISFFRIYTLLKRRIFI